MRIYTDVNGEWRCCLNTRLRESFVTNEIFFLVGGWVHVLRLGGILFGKINVNVNCGIWV